MTNEELVALIQAGVDVQENTSILWGQLRGCVMGESKRFATDGLEQKDLIQEAYFSLLEAIKGYEQKPDGSFLTFFRFILRRSYAMIRHKNRYARLTNMTHHELSLIMKYKKFRDGYAKMNNGRYPNDAECMETLGITEWKLKQLQQHIRESTVQSLSTPVEADNGDQNFGYCVFERNTAQYGAHIRMNGGSANLFNCVLGRGTATIRGGAIACYTDQEVTLEKCSIWENTAAQHGGAIWNRGKLTITQSTIHNNTANGEPDDIVNEYSGQLALMDDYDALVALYATYGLIPNKWAVDTFIDESAERPNMVFSMSFATNDPEPSPEPEPEPTPTPDPEPKIIYRTRTVEKLVKEPEVEPATITNRKAVLKAPDSRFWTGYEIGHGGAGGTVTRADFAALMLSMMDDESRERYYTETAPFDDVAPGVWYAPAIGTATNAGFMLGCGLGVFQPERNLTWGELLTVFSRFTEEETPPEIYTGNHWAKDAINTAISLEWISAGIDPGQTVTTGDLAGFVQTVFKWAEKS